MFKIEALNFLIDNMGTFWKRLPPDNKRALQNVFLGYVQIGSDMLCQLSEIDYSKSLQDIQVTTTRLWRKYRIWYDYDLSFEPDFTYTGVADEDFVWNPEKYINADFAVRGAWDQALLNLHSQIDNFANLYWQAKVTTDSDVGAGGLIGYFNSYSRTLQNTVALGWTDGAIVAMITDQNDITSAEISIPFMDPNQSYVLTGMYVASGGLLEVQAYNEDMSLKLQDVNVRISTVSFGPSGEVSGVVSGFTCDRFGISNFNTRNHIDDILALTSSTTGKYIIDDIKYSDPSINKKIQSIPLLQDRIDEPYLTMTEDTDFYIINSEFYFPTFVPAEYLWAPYTYYDNDAIADNFGAPVRYGIKDGVHTDSIYLNGVKGLWNSYLFGPTIRNIQTGLTILASQPFTEKEGQVIAIDPTYSSDFGSITIRPTDGSNDIIYYYSLSVGLATNPKTGKIIALADVLDRFTTLTDAVEVVDWTTSDDWWRFHLIDQSIQVQKYKSFGIRLSKLKLHPNNIAIMAGNFINHIRPADTKAWFMKEDDTPIFIIGSYDHYPYVDVDVIGDQTSYVPADWVYEDRDELFEYAGNSSIYGGRNTKVPLPESSIPTISVGVPYAFNPGYDFPFNYFGYITGAASSSILFGYAGTLFSSEDGGKTWLRAKAYDNKSDLDFDVGYTMSIFTDKYKETTGCLIAGVKNRVLNGILMEKNGVQYKVSTAEDLQFNYKKVDLVSAETSPTTYGSGNVRIASLTGEALVMGISSLDHTKFSTYKLELDTTAPWYDETGSTANYVEAARTEPGIGLSVYSPRYSSGGFSARVYGYTTGAGTPPMVMELYAGAPTTPFTNVLLERSTDEWNIGLGLSNKTFNFTTPITENTYYSLVLRTKDNSFDPVNYSYIRKTNDTTWPTSGKTIKGFKYTSGAAEDRFQVRISGNTYFPDDYFTLSKKGDFDLGTGEDLTAVTANCLDLFYAGGNDWKLYTTRYYSPIGIEITSSDYGQTWSSPREFVISTLSPLTFLTRFYWDNGLLIFLFKTSGDLKDYVTASNNSGLNWSAPTELSGDGYRFSSKVRPSIVKSNGNYYIIGVTEDKQIVTREISIG